MNYRTSFVSNENRLPASSRNSSGSPSSDTPAAKNAQKNLKKPVSEFKETDYISVLSARYLLHPIRWEFYS
ncbi:DUF6444 domain-containing protein [Candidatus Enterovibrio escicola]|uniref:DUF6444 domain-containing protein n=1 Tax=Candidatus Enterovibrio escicola TaxID=1927127 RepID=UPI0037429C50